MNPVADLGSRGGTPLGYGAEDTVFEIGGGRSEHNHATPSYPSRTRRASDLSSYRMAFAAEGRSHEGVEVAPAIQTLQTAYIRLHSLNRKRVFHQSGTRGACHDDL